VLLHGRSGVYAVNARGAYGAETLRRRDLLWARRWAGLGYVALIVDSFGPRGYPAGFRAGSHEERPPEVDEVTVRPLDAYGALAYLRSRPEVDGARVGLQGWSNGASAALAAMAAGAQGGPPSAGFRAALAFYPGCGLGGRFDRGYRAARPVEILIGDADEEVSPAACRRLAARAAGAGGAVDLTVYPGATHDFDDPLNGRQDAPANVAAKRDATDRAKAFFAAALQP
jgi:carboxymethylenebutenolidase